MGRAYGTFAGGLAWDRDNSGLTIFVVPNGTEGKLCESDGTQCSKPGDHLLGVYSIIWIDCI